MTNNHKRNNRTRSALLPVLVIISLVLTIYELGHTQELQARLSGVSWIGISLLVTEAVFVLGVLLMAISAGEALFGVKKLSHWPGHLIGLRKNIRALAGKMITSRLFAVGFWLNFLGAIGTSVILITAILAFAPYSGVGIVVVIVIDLIATFGWRIPLEMARRKARKNVKN